MAKSIGIFIIWSSFYLPMPQEWPLTTTFSWFVLFRLISFTFPISISNLFFQPLPFAFKKKKVCKRIQLKTFAAFFSKVGIGVKKWFRVIWSNVIWLRIIFLKLSTRMEKSLTMIKVSETRNDISYVEVGEFQSTQANNSIMWLVVAKWRSLIMRLVDLLLLTRKNHRVNNRH